ncbi:MAG: 2-oxoglutarate dehydrogenase E1 subunit family protein, partial [Steroidobacteraceae bacterium]
MPPTVTELLASTPLSAANAPYVEALYEQYLRDPAALDPLWRGFFDRLSPSLGAERPHAPVIAGLTARMQALADSPVPAAASSPPANPLASEKQAAVSRLVQIYSNRGHLIAHLDPLGLLQRPRPRVLELDYAGLSEADLDSEFYTASRNDWIAKRATLREIIARLERIYCGHIGAEFAHVSNTDERLWLQDEFQLGRMQQRFNAAQRRSLLGQLTAAESLERYL